MIEAYYNKTVTLLRAGDRDAYGEANNPTESTVSVVLKGKRRLVRNREGEQVISSEFLWIKGQNITHEDAFRIDGVERPIIAIEPKELFDSKEFEEVSLA